MTTRRPAPPCLRPPLRLLPRQQQQHHPQPHGRHPPPHDPASPSPAGGVGARCPTDLSFLATLLSVVGGVARVARGPEAPALALALALAVSNQACASSAVINYAPELLRPAGVSSDRAAAALTGVVAGAKTVGVAIFACAIDSVGRRPLALGGAGGMAVALILLAAADAAHSPAFLLAAMSIFILIFSSTYAGLFWVLVSELFSMGAKSSATAAATAALFASGAAANLAFLPVHTALGPWSFLVYAAVSAATGLLCWVRLPETRGRALADVSIAVAAAAAPGGGGCASCWPARARYAQAGRRAPATSTESAF